MNEKTLQAIRDHAAKEFGDGSNPRESCGLLIVNKGREQYVPCKNLSTEKDRFRIDPVDYADAEDMGEIVAVVHSHPYLPAVPSEADLIGCEMSNLPWIIVSWPSGETYQFSPSGYKAPLVGRKFIHGVLDCYSLIRDYYKETLNISLPDYEREELWWEKNQNLYIENFENAGFFEVPGGLDDLKLHDVVMMQISSPVVNHAGIYIGDNTVLHHFMNRLSSRDVFGESLRRSTVKIVRYRGLENA